MGRLTRTKNKLLAVLITTFLFLNILSVSGCSAFMMSSPGFSLEIVDPPAGNYCVALLSREEHPDTSYTYDDRLSDEQNACLEMLSDHSDNGFYLAYFRDTPYVYESNDSNEYSCDCYIEGAVKVALVTSDGSSIISNELQPNNSSGRPICILDASSGELKQYHTPVIIVVLLYAALFLILFLCAFGVKALLLIPFSYPFGINKGVILRSTLAGQLLFFACLLTGIYWPGRFRLSYILTALILTLLIEGFFNIRGLQESHGNPSRIRSIIYTVISIISAVIAMIAGTVLAVIILSTAMSLFG